MTGWNARRAERPLAIALAGALLFAATASQAADALPSWKNGKARRAIVEFVERVTRPGPGFVPPAERIAVFDNDGTLWAEQPMYFQLFFLFDRIRALAPAHPEWKTTEPFASVLRGDVRSAFAGGDAAVVEMSVAALAGTTVGEFESYVSDWIARARHPESGRPYTEMVYQPMLELLAYLRGNGFKTYIVSGGGVEFMRAWSERVYGIPPEQVIGSTVRMRFEIRDGKPVVVRLPEVAFIDDKAGKPVGIQTHIGRRPIVAFGNSDGDLQMLQWTCGAPGPQLCAFVRHTDAKREWAYDRKSSVGRLDKGLDEARRHGWTIVDMKSDWNAVFPAQE